MTIQISVLIWTIICFLVLVLILDFLLFKPVLKLLDSRRERVQKAAAKKAEYERLSGEQEALLEERRAALAQSRQKQMKAEMERVRLESKEILEEANVQRLHKVDDYRIRAEAECNELLDALGGHAKELAVAFADSLVKE